MASYTDTQPLPLSPYIPRVNADTYSAVLAYKQGQYDQGVQKVQGILDSASSLDIIKPEDQAYVKGKLDSLTSSINNIANADWGSTNNGLISQVNAHAATVVNDRNVQNAVQATRGIRSLQSSQKEMKEKHPDLYTASAEDYDNSAIAQYMGTKGVGMSYNGPTSATPHHDYDKPIRDALEKIKPGINYRINEHGKFEYEFDKTSTVDIQKIQQVVDGIIAQHPEYQQSIMLDARYSLKDYDGPSLLNRINSFTSENIQALNTQIGNLEKQKLLSSQDPNTVRWADGQIAASRDHINQLSQYYNRYKGYMDGGVPLDKIKNTYYQDEMRSTYGVNFQQENHEIDYKINENAVHEQAAKQWQADHAISVIKSNREGTELSLNLISKGINPEDGTRITPDNTEMWGKYMNASGVTAHTLEAQAKADGKKKKADGTDEGMTAGETTLTGNEASAPTYTRATHEERMAEVDTKIKGIDDTLIGDWLSRNKLPRTKENVALAQQWGKQQAANYWKPGANIDPLYKKWVNIRKDVVAEQQALQNMKTEAERIGNTQFNFEGIKDVAVVPSVGADGKLQNVALPIASHKALVTELQGIVNEMTQAGAVQAMSSGDSGKASSIIDAVLEKHKHSPDFALLKGMAEANRYGSGYGYGVSHFLEYANRVLSPVQQNIQKRVDAEDQYYKAQGKTYNYGRVNLQVDKDREREAKGIVMQTLTDRLTQEQGTEHPKVDLEKITPVSAYQDVDGQGWIEYNYEGKSYKDKLATNNPLIANPDPSITLKRIIETDPSHQTTKFNTDNGHITYSLGKNSLDNTYYVQVYIGSTGYTVPMQHGENPLELRMAVEKFSTTKNPKTGALYTPEEIIQLLKASNQ